jgi:Fur family transcriptional regulator, ferric uptake regulator
LPVLHGLSPVMPQTSNRLADWLRQYNLIPTQQRLTVLAVFDRLGRGEHLSAEAVFDTLRRNGHAISRATVYRTLNRFAAEGLLRTLPLARNRLVYELNQGQLSEHHHLLCLQCEVLIEFRESEILDLAARVAAKQSFDYRACQLVVVGLCPLCSSQQVRAN